MLKEFLSQLYDNLTNYREPLRPPGAVPQKDFTKMCIKCMKCAQVCPYHSIVIAHLKGDKNMGTPFIYPRKTPCYLCMKCPEVCPSGALEIVREREVKMGIAVIDEGKCLPYNDVICFLCFKACPMFREALILVDERYPKVVAEKCVGCGICEKICPVEDSAIIVRRMDTK